MKKLFQKIFSSGVSLPLLLLLPYVITFFLNGGSKALLLYPVDEEKFVPLLLMVQMKGDYEPETVKAQAVIARSELYRRKKEESLFSILQDQETTTKLQWLENAEKLQLYGEAAEETKNQVLTWEGKLKLVPYHKVSNGQTRDGAEAFHSSEYAYLQSVDSSQDREAPDYINSTYVSLSQLPRKLILKERDSAGYVTVLDIDGQYLDGENFRLGLHLASADFSVQKVGKAVRFLCKGKGHGLGFSQYGANEMAKAGSSWKEILVVYFPKMEIQNINDIFEENN